MVKPRRVAVWKSKSSETLQRFVFKESPFKYYLELNILFIIRRFLRSSHLLRINTMLKVF